MIKDKRLEENVWHAVHTDKIKHRYLDLPKDQLERIHFQSVVQLDKISTIQYFIILPPIPKGK